MKKTKRLSRRAFIKRAGVCTAAAPLLGLASCTHSPKKTSPLRGEMPTRTLGKTGLQVSILSFGGGSQFLRNDDGAWEPILERAVQLGVNFFDTASTYRWGASMSSEERFGRILPPYRDQIVLSTKFNERDPDDAKKEFERSLARLNTDYVDILMLHSVEENEDLAAFEKGIYREMVKLKEQGAVRFIGFSSMNSAAKSRNILERFDIDVALLALNPTQYGRFAEQALPSAHARHVGGLAMKVMRDIVGQDATASELLHYAWTLPSVTSAIVGHYGMETLEENARLAREYGANKTPAGDPGELEARLAPLAGPERLCWARPDYRDGDIC